MNDFAEPTNPKSNLNTILLSVTLGALCFISFVSWENSIALAALQASMITRPEFETRLSEIRANQSAVDATITALKVDLAQGRYRTERPGEGNLSNEKSSGSNYRKE